MILFDNETTRILWDVFEHIPAFQKLKETNNPQYQDTIQALERFIDYTLENKLDEKTNMILVHAIALNYVEEPNVMDSLEISSDCYIPILTLIRNHTELDKFPVSKEESAIIAYANKLDRVDMDLMLLYKKLLNPKAENLEEIRKLYYEYVTYPKDTYVKLTKTYDPNHKTKSKGIILGFVSVGKLFGPVVVGNRVQLSSFITEFCTDSVIEILSKNMFRTKKETYKIAKIETSHSFDDILGENKDVLQRLKENGD